MRNSPGSTEPPTERQSGSAADSDSDPPAERQTNSRYAENDCQHRKHRKGQGDRPREERRHIHATLHATLHANSRAKGHATIQALIDSARSSQERTLIA